MLWLFLSCRVVVYSSSLFFPSCLILFLWSSVFKVVSESRDIFSSWPCTQFSHCKDMQMAQDSARCPLSSTHCRPCPLLSARAKGFPPTPFPGREKHLSRRAWSASPTGSPPRCSSPFGGAPLSRGWLPRCRRSATASWTCAASPSGTPKPSQK